jgi:hypothetical protein
MLKEIDLLDIAIYPEGVIRREEVTEMIECLRPKKIQILMISSSHNKLSKEKDFKDLISFIIYYTGESAQIVDNASPKQLVESEYQLSQFGLLRTNIKGDS